MNRILNRKELINIISALLNNKRIVVGGNKETYKRKYHLKYNKKIIDTIITAFCDAIVISLENGDSVRINNYFKIEPYYRKESIMKANGFRDSNIDTNFVPAHYLPKFRAGIKLKEACKKLTEDMRE
ncbi:MAG: HU family DNA-binding protein [Ruminococcaceae bacterium]|nr:HU family DNA-binding protein [Oscillospiraceae bacterium]